MTAAVPLADVRADPEKEARDAGLSYVSDTEPGIRRRANGHGFHYLRPDGSRVSDEATRKRIKSIVIPPAWSDVWISPKANGHIQATGRDARRRKQYRYHPDFRASRETGKYEHLVAFAEGLPHIRRRVDEDMRKRGLAREKVIATIVHLLDTTFIRVGNRDYARQNGSFGLTTLRDRHVVAGNGELRFQFSGKGGKEWRLTIADQRVTRIVKACQDLPGQHLFQYLDDNGERQSITSTDVNAYLREVSGRDVTAKDFRTWAGTVMAAIALRDFPPCDEGATAKVNVRAAVESVAKRLGNTPAICRKCYIHPAVLDGYLNQRLALRMKRSPAAGKRSDPSRLKPEEAAVLAYLRAKQPAAARNGMRMAA